MPPSTPAETAIARWVSHGITSLTHPVLARLLTDCFEPLGITAEWLEAEPFSGIETGAQFVWLRAPRWDPAKISSGLPGAADLQRWAARSSEVSVTTDGILRLPVPGPLDPEPWAAIRHSVAARSRAGAFLCAAAGSLLFDPAAAITYCEANDEVFVQKIWARLDAAKRDRDKTAQATESPGDEAA